MIKSNDFGIFTNYVGGQSCANYLFPFVRIAFGLGEWTHTFIALLIARWMADSLFGITLVSFNGWFEANPPSQVIK